MNKTAVFCAAFFLSQTYLLLENANADPCGAFKFTTPCMEGGTADKFVPSRGKLSAYTKDGDRFVEVLFLWDNDVNLEFYRADNDHTLEPDAMFFGPNHFAQKIDLIDLNMGLAFPPEPIVITSAHAISGETSYYPFPYADAVIDDFEPRIVTVGSVHAHFFKSQVWYRSVSRTYSTYAGKSDFGPMGLRFQRGKWVFHPELLHPEDYISVVCGIDLEPWNPYNELIPVYPLAPICVFSCCDSLPSAYNVVSQEDEVYPPGCATWMFNYSENRREVQLCGEYLCNDGRDNDIDGLIDCDDPDCANSPDCSTIINPPADPCSNVVGGNGYYCGSNEELTDYSGNNEDLVYCQNGVTISVEYCEEGCQQNLPGQNDECIDTSCTPICSSGQTQCNGNNVEVCAADQCSFDFSYSCPSNQTCVNGSCITPTMPAPIITSVSCTSYFRGDTNVTCTIYGSNFDCGPGSNTFIGGGYYNAPAQSCASTQLVISLDWICLGPIGFVQVSHRNPDNQRDDEYNVLEVLMGELTITSAWQPIVHEGATNVPMGANGCNFGQNVVFWAGGIQISNTHLQAEDQVLATGTVVGSAADSPVDLCVAKYPGASIGFDKKCLPGHVTIIP